MVDKKLFEKAVTKLKKIADTLYDNEDLYKDLCFADASSVADVRKIVEDISGISMLIDEKNQSADYYHDIIPSLLENYARAGWNHKHGLLSVEYVDCENDGCAKRAVDKFIHNCKILFANKVYNTNNRVAKYLKDYFEQSPSTFEKTIRGLVGGKNSEKSNSFPLIYGYIYQLINQNMYNFARDNGGLAIDKINSFVGRLWSSPDQLRNTIIEYLAENKYDFVRDENLLTQKSLTKMIKLGEIFYADSDSKIFDSFKKDILLKMFENRGSQVGDKLRGYLDRNCDKPAIKSFNEFVDKLARQIRHCRDVQDIRTIDAIDVVNMVTDLSSDLKQLQEYNYCFKRIWYERPLHNEKVDRFSKFLKKLSEVSNKREDFTNPNIYGILSYKKGQKVAEHVVEEPVEEVSQENVVEEVVSSDESYESAVLTSPIRTQTESILTKYNIEKNDNVIDKYKKYQQSKNLIKKSYAKEVQEFSTKEILDAIRDGFTAEDWENAHETLNGEFLKRYYADIIRTLFESDLKDVDTKHVILDLTDTALDLGM